MLRCLILFRSAAMSSSRLIVLPSRTLATIRTYGRMREFTRVDSSSTKPSRWQRECSRLALQVRISLSCRTRPPLPRPRESALGESAVSWLDCSGERRRGRHTARFPPGGLAACRNVELFLVPSAFVRLIVLPAPLVAKLATMVLLGSQRDSGDSAGPRCGMRKEANPAVAAAHRAVLQIRTIPQGRIQRQLILTNKRTGAVVLVPILAKRENFRDGYSKIARFSVKMLIVLASPRPTHSTPKHRGEGRGFLSSCTCSSSD